MRRTQSKGLQLMKLTIACCASLSLLAVTSQAQVSGPEAASHHERRSIPPPAPPPGPVPAPVPVPASVTGAATPPQAPTDPACKKLPITPDTWKSLNIDNTLRSLGQNMTISQYAAANGAGNFICGIGENCNAGQLCHPVKAPAWQILYATQEYTAFMNALTDSVNYALSQLQAISASMSQDLVEDIADSRLEVNLKWLFTDLYRGIAYGATALFLITFIGLGAVGSMFFAAQILLMTAVGMGIASWIQGAPKTASFAPWSKLSFYISQAQGAIAGHITEATEKTFKEGINAENGLAKILAGGTFFTPASTVGLMETTEKAILRVVQGRLLARLLRGQNAYVTISPDECHGKGPGGASEGNDVLSYCDPQQKLLFNVVRAHKKKTINTVHGASAITNKYGFSVEFIVKNSWECQKKYGNFEHDVFAEISKVAPADIMNTDCVINLPVCDMRDDYVRNLKFSRHKTTTYACRKGGGLPI
ncbi:hypothetical protein MJO29_010146 [Puccinia striiformis f. sp. tritici]|uniref:DUF7872 domain-containing protein n=1 Tax=Puccinia striiformis f. sp. tritici PST-78 TaxID=1165861 RepID=A0A0L0V9E7_9BASI|nr:hypothetical protein Pst134EA_019199 [Puccinia striiformis f. sp. tritici]KAH9449293.1 hypothetical protein Pst134EB_020117 [Puccinia striiformis f. sp. tritici]KAH9459049.1 hypothetical protein Pst134EA_019199 [Puccinia striiformis f. sp. tritici]KAI7948481.1 hypothetical protein MJO29_010146 [Puccinia striiformis f. sp. tritici]KNE95912.1 hypothetical protein PSTG_10829 [Puccinia striiformis f. sp. tritici PST-78]